MLPGILPIRFHILITLSPTHPIHLLPHHPGNILPIQMTIPRHYVYPLTPKPTLGTLYVMSVLSEVKALLSEPEKRSLRTVEVRRGS